MEMKLMLLCDEELAAMVKNGDGAAFDVLMERFMPYLRFKSRVYFCAGIEMCIRDSLRAISCTRIYAPLLPK